MYACLLVTPMPLANCDILTDFEVPSELDGPRHRETLARQQERKISPTR